MGNGTLELVGVVLAFVGVRLRVDDDDGSKDDVVEDLEGVGERKGGGTGLGESRMVVFDADVRNVGMLFGLTT